MIQNKFYQDIFMNMPCKCPLKIYLINLKITQPRIHNRIRSSSKTSFREYTGACNWGRGQPPGLPGGALPPMSICPLFFVLRIDKTSRLTRVQTPDQVLPNSGQFWPDNLAEMAWKSFFMGCHWAEGGQKLPPWTFLVACPWLTPVCPPLPGCPLPGHP